MYQTQWGKGDKRLGKGIPSFSFQQVGFYYLQTLNNILGYTGEPSIRYHSFFYPDMNIPFLLPSILLRFRARREEMSKRNLHCI